MKIFAQWGRAGFATTVLLVCGCRGDGKTAESSDAQAEKAVALVVDGISIEKAEVDRLAEFLRGFFYNLSPDEARGAVLVNSLVPRAASLAHFGAAEVEKQRQRILAAAKRLDAGEDFYKVGEEMADLPVRSPETPELEWAALSKLDFLLGEALFSLPVGSVSKPILSRHGWYILKVIERKILASRSHATGRFHAIVCAFEKSPDFESRIREWTNKAEIRIVDPAYDRILPEWMKYRPGARTWRPMEISPGNSPAGGK